LEKRYSPTLSFHLVREKELNSYNIFISEGAFNDD
jgi:hypothetical protein